MTQRTVHNYLRLCFIRLALTRYSILISTLLALALSSVGTAPARASFFEDAWNQVFNNSPPKPRSPTGSRGGEDEFCAVAPILDESTVPASTPIVYSDRPMLVWQGATERVELWQRGSDRPLWTHRVSEADRVQESSALTDRTTYQVTAPESLPPDQRYEWRVYPPALDYSVARFRTASLEERDRINQNLSQVTAEQTATAATIQRADYFAGQQMWSDFWQTLFAEQPLSQELAALNGNTIATLCPLVSASSILSISSETGLPEASQNFDAEANQTIELRLESQEAATQFTLLDPQGKEIGTGTAQPDRPVSQLFTLPIEGKYTVRLQPAETPTQNQYTLVVMSRFNAQ